MNIMAITIILCRTQWLHGGKNKYKIVLSPQTFAYLIYYYYYIIICGSTKVKQVGR